MARDLLHHVARFAAALRERGIEIGLSEEIDATQALSLVDLTDRAEVYWALRTTFRVRHRDHETFDVLFDLHWSRGDPDLTLGLTRRTPLDGAGTFRRFDRAGSQAFEETPPRGSGDSDDAGYAPERLLRHKQFEELTPQEQAAMDRLLARLAVRLATRPSRRLEPSANRGRVDLRRSFRGALATDGELIRLARRSRRLERPALVALCDTSGSMDLYSRFLLAFVLALRRATRGTEIFAFNTSLTRLTGVLSTGNVRHTLDRLAAEVPDWSGGTRLGDCLGEFVETYLDEVVSSRSVALIFSDGLDLGSTDRLAAAMDSIRARARKIVWLNPLAGDARYRPEARGMQAALPYVDHLLPAHNLEALERALPLIAA